MGRERPNAARRRRRKAHAEANNRLISAITGTPMEVINRIIREQYENSDTRARVEASLEPGPISKWFSGGPNPFEPSE